MYIVGVSPLVSREDAHQVSEMCSGRFRGCRKASGPCTAPGFGPAAESLPQRNAHTSPPPLFTSLSFSTRRILHNVRLSVMINFNGAF